METPADKRHRVTVRPAQNRILWDRLWDWLLSAPEDAVGENPLQDEELKESESEIDPKRSPVE